MTRTKAARERRALAKQTHPSTTKKTQATDEGWLARAKGDAKLPQRTGRSARLAVLLVERVEGDRLGRVAHAVGGRRRRVHDNLAAGVELKEQQQNAEHSIRRTLKEQQRNDETRKVQTRTRRLGTPHENTIAHRAPVGTGETECSDMRSWLTRLTLRLTRRKRPLGDSGAVP